MQEKRLRRQAEQSESTPDVTHKEPDANATSIKHRLGSVSTKTTTKRSFSPISFSARNTAINPEPQKNKKFKPVVFDLEEGEAKPTSASRAKISLQLGRGGGDGENGNRKESLSPVVFDMESSDVAVSSTGK